MQIIAQHLPDEEIKDSTQKCLAKCLAKDLVRMFQSLDTNGDGAPWSRKAT